MTCVVSFSLAYFALPCTALLCTASGMENEAKDAKLNVTRPSFSTTKQYINIYGMSLRMKLCAHWDVANDVRHTPKLRTSQADDLSGQFATERQPKNR